AQTVEGQFVSGNYFRTLGVDAAIGRTITPVDDRPTASSWPIVLTFRYWMRAFAGKSDVVGRQLSINGVSAVIVGVMPEAFEGASDVRPPDLMLPIAMQASLATLSNPLKDSGLWYLYVMGRIKGTTHDEEATAEIEGLLRQHILQSSP